MHGEERGLRYAFAGIPLGLAAGLLIGFCRVSGWLPDKNGRNIHGAYRNSGRCNGEHCDIQARPRRNEHLPHRGRKVSCLFRLDAVNHCITLKLPWPFLAELIAAMTVIYLIFTAYAGAELKKTGILSAIREE